MNKMHRYYMEIREETESENQSELKLWVNDKDRIYLEVGPVDNEDAPYYTGFITLTKDDAHALMDELFRLIKLIESRDDDDGPLTLAPPLPNRQKGLQNSVKAEGKQLTLTQPCPDPDSGQVPIPSKVNWNA